MIKTFTYLLLIIKIITIYPQYTVPTTYIHTTSLPKINECEKYSEDIHFTYKIDSHFEEINMTKSQYPYYIIDIQTVGFKLDRYIDLFVNGQRKMFAGRERYVIYRKDYKPEIEVKFLTLGKGPMGRIADLEDFNIQFVFTFMANKIILNYKVEIESVFLDLEFAHLTNPISYGKGCLDIKFRNNCAIAGQDSFFIEVPDNRFFEGVSNNCEVEVDGVKRILECEKDYENNKLVLKDFLTHADFNRVVLCGIENPSNFNLFPFTFGTLLGANLIKSSIERQLRADQPMQNEILSYSVLNLEVDSPFNSDISVCFKTHVFEKENFVISLALPEVYKHLNNISMTYTNLYTHSKQTFLDIEKDSNFMFNVKLFTEKVNVNSGIKIEVFGFNIPEVYGKMDLTFKIMDERMEKIIVEEIKQDFEILRADKSEFLLHLDDYNMNSKINAILDFSLENVNPLEKLNFHFSGSTGIDLDTFDTLEQITPFTYDIKKIDKDNNKLVMNGVVLEKDEKFFRIQLNNLRTKYLDANNAHVKLDIYQLGKKISHDYFFKLKKINLQVSDREISTVDNQNFKIELNFNLNKSINFPHYLKITTSNILQLDSECVKDTNLPYQPASGVLSCKDATKNNLVEKTILLVDQLKDLKISKNYRLILKGKFNGKPSNMEKVVLEVIPNLPSDSLNELWDKKDFKISNEKNVFVYLNCPSYCKECNLSDQTCGKCLNGLTLVNGECTK